MVAVDDETAKQVVADNVAKYRTLAGLSLAELGRRCLTSAGAIRNIEMAERAPGPGLLSRLAAALGVTADALLDPGKKKSAKAS